MDQENNENDKEELVNPDAELEAGIKQVPKEPLSPSLSAECKICQAEDFLDKLESPCDLVIAAVLLRYCIQLWINSCYNTMCEICEQHYEGGFTITVPLPPTTEELEAQREAQMARREAETEAERTRAEARRVAGEALVATLPDLNNTAIGECVVCRISSLLCLATYILLMVALETGLLDLRLRPPLYSPSPHPRAPDQLPQLFMKNISARALRLWL